MKPYYDSYKEPGNNTMMSTHEESEVTCSNCHDAPGPGGKIEAYGKAVGEVYYYTTNTYDEDNLGGDVPDEYCLKCHDGDLAIEPGEIKLVNETVVNPHDDNYDLDCADCHLPHEKGIGLSTEACTVCHNVEVTELEKHGERADEECYKCHDGAHPKYAYIPFKDNPDIINNEFCSDCHQEQYFGFKNWSETDIEFYKNCTEACHNEHSESVVPHATELPYQDDCNSCHTDTVASHNLSTVIYSNFEPEISDEFCSDCHKNEYDLYSTWPSSKSLFYGNCNNVCHTEHRQITGPHSFEAPYENNCDSCHVKGYESHKTSDVKYKDFSSAIPEEFCSDCHAIQYNSFQDGTHSSYDCLLCHDEHEQTQINFEMCEVCHTKLEEHDDHNETTTGCANCHGDDFDKVHKVNK
jgi:hypothetical protein